MFYFSNEFHLTEGKSNKMNKNRIKKTLTTISALLFSTQAFMLYADEGHHKYHRTCTPAALEAADLYDPGSSALTECIGVRDDFKVVVAWNSTAINGNILKNNNEKVGQQVVNARNLIRDYNDNYNMTQGEEYKMVVVAYSGGVDWLKKEGNDPMDIEMVKGLLEKGVKIYACQNTMKAKKLVAADLIDGVRIVPSGVSAVVDFSNRRYTYLNP